MDSVPKQEPRNIMDLASLCAKVRDLAIQAGEAILDIYQTSFTVEYKDDQSPLTNADQAANDIICQGLRGLTPEIPIISEENKQHDYSIRRSWEYLWLVDPLDGTKEFVNRNGDFTVNIALIHNGKPVLGVVYIPVTSEMYWGWTGSGAWKSSIDNTVQLHVSQFNSDLVRIVASRSHNTPETEEFIKTFNNPTVRSRGSSIKLLMVAEGEADIYPRIAPTMEWDTAAADIIVREAGGRVVPFSNSLSKNIEDLKYNKPNLLNPFFLVCSESYFVTKSEN